MRALLDGESVEVGAARPAHLPHHRPVPIWIAAGGPRTLRMAGGVADGVFIRVGTHPANIAQRRRGHPRRRRRGGPRSVRRAHGAPSSTPCWWTSPTRALAMGKSMAAGYYEYSPTLFEAPGFDWSGPDPETLKHEHKVWPDFHHAPDLEASGRAVDFLPPEAADAFCLRGGPDADRRATRRGDRRGAGAARLRRLASDPGPGDARRSRARLHGARGARDLAARAGPAR